MTVRTLKTVLTCAAAVSLGLGAVAPAHGVEGPRPTRTTARP